jgi:hypothetical protein
MRSEQHSTSKGNAKCQRVEDDAARPAHSDAGQSGSSHGPWQSFQSCGVSSALGPPAIGRLQARSCYCQSFGMGRCSRSLAVVRRIFESTSLDCSVADARVTAGSPRPPTPCRRLNPRWANPCWGYTRNLGIKSPALIHVLGKGTHYFGTGRYQHMRRRLFDCEPGLKTLQKRRRERRRSMRAPPLHMPETCTSGHPRPLASRRTLPERRGR